MQEPRHGRVPPYIHVYIYIYTHIYTYTYTYVYTCMYMCIYVYTYIHTYIPTYLPTYIHTYSVAWCVYITNSSYACTCYVLIRIPYHVMACHVAPCHVTQNIISCRQVCAATPECCSLLLFPPISYMNADSLDFVLYTVCTHMVHNIDK